MTCGTMFRTLMLPVDVAMYTEELDADVCNTWSLVGDAGLSLIAMSPCRSLEFTNAATTRKRVVVETHINDDVVLPV